MDLTFGRAIDAILIVVALGAAVYYFVNGQTERATLFLGAAVLFVVYDLVRHYLNDVTGGDRGEPEQ